MILFVNNSGHAGFTKHECVAWTIWMNRLSSRMMPRPSKKRAKIHNLWFIKQRAWLGLNLQVSDFIWKVPWFNFCHLIQPVHTLQQYLFLSPDLRPYLSWVHLSHLFVIQLCTNLSLCQSCDPIDCFKIFLTLCLHLVLLLCRFVP